MKTLIALLFVAALSIIPEPITGHGHMVLPLTWFERKVWVKTPEGYKWDYVGIKSGQQCVAGRSLPRHLVCNENDCDEYPYPGRACMWYTNNTFIEKPTIFDPKIRTYTHSADQEIMLKHPWRAPGTAFIHSPCGAAGGNPNGCVPTDECEGAGAGFGHGKKAEEVEYPYDFYVTNYTRGEVVEVAWGIRTNHGGGYSYRLCKKPEKGIKFLTEECFQQTPLRFVGDKAWIQYGEDESSRFEFDAIRIDEGTFPPGSQWTRNPIPACDGVNAGADNAFGQCPDGAQFPPLAQGLQGFGVDIGDYLRSFPFSIVDKVQIPKDLEPGEYVMSFRWDTEGTAQVWNACAAISLA